MRGEHLSYTQCTPVINTQCYGLLNYLKHCGAYKALFVTLSVCVYVCIQATCTYTPTMPSTIKYNRDVLLEINNSLPMVYLPQSVYQDLKTLKIAAKCPTKRGCRGGKRKRWPIKTLVTSRTNKQSVLGSINHDDLKYTSPQPSNANNELNLMQTTPAELEPDVNSGAHQHLLRSLPKQDITYDSSKLFKISLINLQSVRNKIEAVIHHVKSSDIMICLMTETWVKETDVTLPNVFQTAGLKFLSVPRLNRPGGGLGILADERFTVTIKKLKNKTVFTSFEHGIFEVKYNTDVVYFVLVYRTPYSDVNPVTTSTFLQEFVSRVFGYSVI